MLINVDDPRLNLILNACFWGIGFVALLSLIPWGRTGVDMRVARWLPLPAFVLYGLYEWAMPSRMDIRVDLLLIIPMGIVILVAWSVRMALGGKRPES